MRSITWCQTGGKTHRVVIDEGSLVSPLHELLCQQQYQPLNDMSRTRQMIILQQQIANQSQQMINQRAANLGISCGGISSILASFLR